MKAEHSIILSYQLSLTRSVHASPLSLRMWPFHIYGVGIEPAPLHINLQDLCN